MAISHTESPLRYTAFAGSRQSILVRSDSRGVGYQPPERTDVEQKRHGDTPPQRPDTGHPTPRRSNACWEQVPWPPNHR